MRIEIHIENTEQILKRLEDSGKRAKPVLKKAVNEAAKKARKKLHIQAKQRYTIKSGSFPQKELRIKKATVSRLCASIQVSGEPLSLPKSYKTSKNGKRTAAKAAVKKGALKPLQKNGLKGFMGQMKSNHKGIFQRTSGKRLPIKELMGPSVAKLSEKVYQPLEGEIQSDLRDILAQFVNEIF